ncbi:uncharacterized protein BP01DRAFT_32758 [Aspergillus saccharolyticus JOP 1030-1]|uniref:Purine and uridine phosphorylase n=1 Tax=Aspergillus saccharolyticus JOP 1030-1 TaxID=1450539 RepID=A0A318ZEW9_9EURO|nr:hypothetical protein BP01DRAFT_32758 [Aspergillus saccharolyticus JOP 1030-1]PYH45969.1 hypothetical protein BP01DRAFT_32758 [Aspergillus saccharolyticus JOP 1030-1]
MALHHQIREAVVEIGIISSSKIVRSFFQATVQDALHFTVHISDNPEAPPTAHDVYTTGSIGHHPVLLADIHDADQASAAALALRFYSRYPHLKVVFLVGICGGMPTDKENNDIMLGDVIIGKSVVQHGFGRMYPDGFAMKHGAEDRAARQGHRLESFVAKLESMTEALERQMQPHLRRIFQSGKDGADYSGLHEDRCFVSSYQHKHHSATDSLCTNDGVCCFRVTQTSCEQLKYDPQYLQFRNSDRYQSARHSKIHFGTIASGNVSIQQACERDKLFKSTDTIGIDVETAAVWDYVPCIPIKGVAHYSDGHQSGNWELHAAAIATACAMACLELWQKSTSQISQGPPAVIPNYELKGYDHKMIAETGRAKK